ncbi:MAG TPA: RIP metalloprotease RseP [Spirochaetales bacterium]|nr:RIP metalloprotease RseP [Spirochaetales bacterium]
MTIATIALGLVGLGFVVFFHELGHFIMARLVGVEVEEFSIGMGPRLLSRRFGKTAYTLSSLPIGGYCRMKGEDSFKKAIEQGLNEFPRESGSYFGAAPLKRILIALGGPFANVVLAFILYAAIAGAGYETRSWENRIVLASDTDGSSYPADRAGLASGDRIVAIGGEAVSSFSEIQEAIALSARKPIPLTVDRHGESFSLVVEPELDAGSGAGRVGVYPWIEPVVETVAPDGAAALAGLRPGDRIVAINGEPAVHGVAIASRLEADRPAKITVAYERGGFIAETTVVLAYSEERGADLGVGWKSTVSKIQAESLGQAMVMGVDETADTISATYRGIASLFMGVNLLQAVSGPARITWMVGTVAKSGLTDGTVGGFSTLLGFLAILSIGLFAMNLLPIPLLDGGSIALFVVELVRRKAPKVKTVLRYQTIGLVAVAALFLLSTIGDVLFFSGR